MAIGLIKTKAIPCWRYLPARFTSVGKYFLLSGQLVLAELEAFRFRESSPGAICADDLPEQADERTGVYRRDRGAQNAPVGVDQPSGTGPVLPDATTGSMVSWTFSITTPSRVTSIVRLATSASCSVSTSANCSDVEAAICTSRLRRSSSMREVDHTRRGAAVPTASMLGLPCRVREPWAAYRDAGLRSAS